MHFILGISSDFFGRLSCLFFVLRCVLSSFSFTFHRYAPRMHGELLSECSDVLITVVPFHNNVISQHRSFPALTASAGVGWAVVNWFSTKLLKRVEGGKHAAYVCPVHPPPTAPPRRPLPPNRLSQVPYTGGLDTLAELRELDVSHNSITVGVPGSGPPRLRLFWTAHNRFGQGMLEVPWATLQVSLRTCSRSFDCQILPENNYKFENVQPGKSW